jgi:flagellar FliL protein
MADIKEQNEATQAEPEAAPPPKAKPARNSDIIALLTKVSILGIVVLVAVLAAYLVTVKVLKPMMAQAPPDQQTVAVEQPEPEPEPEAHGAGGHGEEHAEVGETDFYSVESIVVNPAGTAGTRFLSCSVSFELADKDAQKTFEQMDVRIKDLLITILSSKTVDELSDVSSRNRMRREMLVAVNRMTSPAKANAVYLTDFVLQ